MTLSSPSRSRLYVAGVALAVLVGLILRWWFRVGFVAGFPQDDGIYINVARALTEHVDLVARYRALPAGYLANPAEIYTFRIVFLYPLSWCFRLFGEGDFAAVLPGVLSAMASIVVVAEIARAAMGRMAGFAAALLLACLPYDILLTTRVLSDGPLRLFVALACLCAVRGWSNESVKAFGLCGLMLGLAYLTKLPGASLFVLFVVVMAIRSIRLRSVYGVVSCVAGFAVVVAVETVWYYWRTGVPFLHYRIVHSAILYKLQAEPTSAANIGRYLRVLWEGEFLWYAPVVMGLSAVGYHSFAGLGSHGWVWLAGLLPALRSRMSSARVLAGLAIGLYLFVELFPLDVRIEAGRLQYALVYRQWRFISLLTPAWVALGGMFIAWLWRKNELVGGAVLVGCLLTGWPGFLRNYEVLHGSQRDLRTAAAFLAQRSEAVYTDGMALSSLRYHMGAAGRVTRLSDVAALKGALPSPGDLVLLGGRRGIEVLADVWEKTLPPWSRVLLENGEAPPSGWRVLLRVAGDHDATRPHDLTIVQYVGS